MDQESGESRKKTVKHVVNGDQQAGWYCYQCNFFTRKVAEAAEHDGMMELAELRRSRTQEGGK